ncbi:MAG: hypothetical protein ACOYOQ_00100 [Microthrixaceae bacterium]
MNSTKATDVVRLIGELWPHPEMTPTRASFYATALSNLPDYDDALRAIYTLFVGHRHQPTPAEVIDATLGTEDKAAAEWQMVVYTASRLRQRLLGDRERLDRHTLVALRRVGYDLRSLPVEDPRALDRVRRDFTRTFTEQARKDMLAGPRTERKAIAEAS